MAVKHPHLQDKSRDVISLNLKSFSVLFLTCKITLHVFNENIVLVVDFILSLLNNVEHVC